MEELEKAGVTGYVGKVNMDRNAGPSQEETAESLAQGYPDAPLHQLPDWGRAAAQVHVGRRAVDRPDAGGAPPAP